MVDLHAVPARTWHSKTDGVPLLPSVGRLVGGVLSNVGRLEVFSFFGLEILRLRALGCKRRMFLPKNRNLQIVGLCEKLKTG